MKIKNPYVIFTFIVSSVLLVIFFSVLIIETNRKGNILETNIWNEIKKIHEL
jgi:hypothetical protein